MRLRTSARQIELAEQLAEKAAQNLRRAGKKVYRSSTTGRYVVEDRPSRRKRADLRNDDIPVIDD